MWYHIIVGSLLRKGWQYHLHSCYVKTADNRVSSNGRTADFDSADTGSNPVTLTTTMVWNRECTYLTCVFQHENTWLSGID